MVQISIFYSLRKDKAGLPTLALFSVEDCAKLDQEYFKYWSKPCYGSFNLDVKGVAYIDAVKTVAEYIEELEEYDKPPQDLIQVLQEVF